MKIENFSHSFEIKKNNQKFFTPQEYLDFLKLDEQEEVASIYKKVIELSEEIKNSGGQALLAGGSVRDFYFGKIPKDFDLEVYGLEARLLENILVKFGKVNDVGKTFGILKVNIGGDLDIDVSLPRVDSKISDGHRGFDVKTDPNMDTREAAKRRDFTINSLMADPLTGELIDHFNGLDDIKNRVLRVTDSERFKDDPLRVMRALQFVSRFGLKIDQETSLIIQETAPKLKELPKERLLEEWKKLLTKGSKPSLGLMAGLQLDIFKEIHPQLISLVNVPQDKKWHPEGDAWMHTLMAVDEAANICRSVNISEKNYFTIMLAVMCHDLGKATCSQEVDGKIVSYGHEKAGVVPAKDFLQSIGVDKESEERVVKLVANHMAPMLFYDNEVVRGDKVTDTAIKKLASKIYPATIKDLVIVSMADHYGRGSFDEEDVKKTESKNVGNLSDFNNYSAGEWLLFRSKKIGVEQKKAEKLISGKDLIARGFSRPNSRNEGINFGKAIELGDRLNFLFEQLSLEIDDLSLNFDKDKYFDLIKDVADIESAVAKLKTEGINLVQRIREINRNKINK